MTDKKEQVGVVEETLQKPQQPDLKETREYIQGLVLRGIITFSHVDEGTLDLDIGTMD